MYRRLDLIHVSYEPPFASTPRFNPLPPVLVTFVPSFRFTNVSTSFEKTKVSTRHATCQRDSSPRGSGTRVRHLSTYRNREMSARRETQQGNGKHGRSCCSCLSMLPYGIANKQVPVLWIHLSPLHTIDRASVFRHTVDVKKKKEIPEARKRGTRWKREIGCVSSKV